MNTQAEAQEWVIELWDRFGPDGTYYLDGKPFESHSLTGTETEAIQKATDILTTYWCQGSDRVYLASSRKNFSRLAISTDSGPLDFYATVRLYETP